jgi:hypothetical protein
MPSLRRSEPIGSLPVSVFSFGSDTSDMMLHTSSFELYEHRQQNRRGIIGTVGLNGKGRLRRLSPGCQNRDAAADG